MRLNFRFGSRRDDEPTIREPHLSIGLQTDALRHMRSITVTVQLFMFLLFRTAFCGPKGATGEVFEPVYEGGITQGPSCGLGAAQCL